MAGETIERRLAAIVCADVVGYSRLMEVDEEATIRALNVCRQVVDEMVANHHGRVFGSAGDSVINRHQQGRNLPRGQGSYHGSRLALRFANQRGIGQRLSGLEVRQ